MPFEVNDANNLITHVLAGAGALAAVAWLVAYLIPVTRQLMLDWIGAILLQFAVTGLLWHSRYAASEVRFWTLLASAWTLNAMATVGWGIHWWLAGQKDPPLLSWVDVLYGGRYVLAFLALGALTNLPWLPIVAAGAIAAGVVWVVVRTQDSETRFRFLGKGLYAVIDVMLACAAFLAWRETGWATAGFLTLVLVIYGVANWINLVHTSKQSRLARLFWPLSDAVALASVVWI